MNKYKNILAPILAALCWSSAYITINIAFASFRPVTIVFFRVIIAAFFMLIIGFSFFKLDKIKKPDIKWFVLLVLLEPFAYFLCEVYGLTMVSATLAAVILATIPLFTPLFSTLILKDKVTISNMLGLVISMLGVGLIILDGKDDFYFKWQGLIFMFGAVIVSIIYALYVKRLTERYSEITIITAQNVIGIFLFLPLFLLLDLSHWGELPIESNAVVAVIILGIFASALAFIFYTYSLKHNGIIKTNAYLNLLPAITAVLAYYIIDERLTKQMIIGIIIAIGGLYVSQLRAKKN